MPVPAQRHVDIGTLTEIAKPCQLRQLEAVQHNAHPNIEYRYQDYRLSVEVPCRSGPSEYMSILDKW